MSRSPVNSSGYIGLPLSINELAWVDAMCVKLQVKRTQLLRMGLHEVARQSGEPCQVRLKVGDSYDRLSTSPRAMNDKDALFDRRVSGETVRSLAVEYGVTAGYMNYLMSTVAKERGGNVQQLIRADLKEMTVRVLDDPFIGIGGRTRAIAETILKCETYEEAAEQMGVTRQRVHQVAVRIRRACGVPDGRKRRTVAA